MIRGGAASLRGQAEGTGDKSRERWLRVIEGGLAESVSAGVAPGPGNVSVAAGGSFLVQSSGERQR